MDKNTAGSIGTMPPSGSMTVAGYVASSVGQECQPDNHSSGSRLLAIRLVVETAML